MLAVPGRRLQGVWPMMFMEGSAPPSPPLICSSLERLVACLEK